MEIYQSGPYVIKSFPSHSVQVPLAPELNVARLQGPDEHIVGFMDLYRKKHSTLRLQIKNMYPYPVNKIGGTNNMLMVVFEVYEAKY